MSVEKLIKAGGPAFPLPDPFVMAPGNETQMRSVAVGMTLRDHFAGLAMQALLAEPQWKGESEARYFKVAPEPDEAVDQIALAAYRIADAMLKARATS